MTLHAKWILVTESNVGQLLASLPPDQRDAITPGCVAIKLGDKGGMLTVWPERDRFAYYQGGKSKWGHWQWQRTAQILDEDEGVTWIALPRLTHSDLQKLISDTNQTRVAQCGNRDSSRGLRIPTYSINRDHGARI